MDTSKHGESGRIFSHILAGLETGVLAGLATLAWFALSSLWQGQSVWTTPNLLGTTFYGDLTFRRSFGTVTVAGVALQLCISGILGALFGLAMREVRNSFRVTLFGILLGLGWYYLCLGVIWKRWNSMSPLHSSQRSMLLACLLFGSLLGRYPHFLSSIRQNQLARD